MCEIKKKVAVICPPRSGSNLLCNSLCRHTLIHNYGEKLKEIMRRKLVKESKALRIPQTFEVKNFLNSLYLKTKKPVFCIKILFSHFTFFKKELEPLLMEEQYKIIL